MTTRPVLIFIPGAWHPPSVFNALIYNLKSFGYECIALPLIAVSDSFIPKALSAVKNLQPDIDNVHKSVLKEVEKEKDVVVVAHSWGGIIVGGALEGLGKADREETGKKGGVVKIAYMCSFVPPEGVSLIDAFGGKVPDWYDIKEPWVWPKNPIQLFFHDLPPSEAEYWASQLRAHSYATKSFGTQSAAWRTIPSAYLICEDDRAIPVAVQEAMVKACQDSGAQMSTVRIPSGHSPFLSKPNKVVEFLRE